MPHKESRKIIKIGKTSLGVILPRAWLRFFGLTHRNKVNVISNSKVVIIPLLKKSLRAFHESLGKSKDNQNKTDGGE